MRSGPCLINGARRNVLEVGMQSAFVELGPDDNVDDEIVLLGDGICEEDCAAAWSVSPQNALLQLASLGQRNYL
jgi:alanine racemase